MRLLIVLVFLTTIKTYSQDTSLTGNWVAVDCEPIGKDFITMTNGLILSFDNDSVKLTTVLTTTDTVVSFKLKGKKLTVAGKKFGTIVKINNDSLVLVSNRNRRTTYRKILPSLTEKTSINLTANNWYISYPTGQEFKQRMTFYDSAARQRGWKVCFMQTPGQKFKRQEICEWSLKEIGPDIIITVQHGFGGPQSFYQVTKVSTNKFELKNLSDGDNTGLLLEKSYSNKNKETLFDLVTSKTWKTEEVLSYSTQSDEPIQILDTTVYLGHFVNYEDTTLVKLEELLGNQVTLKFDKTNLFEIMVNKRLLQTGTWNFSTDCEYIVLDDGLRPEDYIELIEANDKSLTIGKQDELKTGTDKGSVKYYYKLRLD
jgi:hypothetical protein